MENKIPKKFKPFNFDYSKLYDKDMLAAFRKKYRIGDNGIERIVKTAKKKKTVHKKIDKMLKTYAKNRRKENDKIIKNVAKGGAIIYSLYNIYKSIRDVKQREREINETRKMQRQVMQRVDTLANVAGAATLSAVGLGTALAGRAIAKKMNKHPYLEEEENKIKEHRGNKMIDKIARNLEKIAVKENKKAERDELLKSKNFTWNASAKQNKADYEAKRLVNLGAEKGRAEADIDRADRRYSKVKGRKENIETRKGMAAVDAKHDAETKIKNHMVMRHNAKLRSDARKDGGIIISMNSPLRKYRNRLRRVDERKQKIDTAKANIENKKKNAITKTMLKGEQKALPFNKQNLMKKLKANTKKIKRSKMDKIKSVAKKVIGMK